MRSLSVRGRSDHRLGKDFQRSPPDPWDSGRISERLPHGYTNATSSDGVRVVKRYLGPDAVERRTREVAALRGLAGVLPVPPVLEVGDAAIVLGWVAGTPGQELLELAPARVLHSVGAMARSLHALDPTLVPELEGHGSLVHGDFGPQNLLLDPDTYAVTALLDWELVHLGDPVEDLAWTEWIVRTHHPGLAERLPALFDGYGDEPPWPERHAAMLAKCAWALDFVTRWSGADSPGAAMWRDRTAATEAYRADGTSG